MFKDELDKLARERYFEVKQPNIDKQVEKDAQYLWEKIKKIFIKKVSGNEDFSIYIMIHNNENLMFSNHIATYKYVNNGLIEHLISFKKFQFPLKTRDALLKLAKQDGIGATISNKFNYGNGCYPLILTYIPPENL